MLVEVSRIKPETRMLRLEHAARFRDAALAQNNRLLALGQRLANDGPFLECDLEHVASSQKNITTDFTDTTDARSTHPIPHSMERIPICWQPPKGASDGSQGWSE